jgi:general secretion pathway protein A
MSVPVLSTLKALTNFDFDSRLGVSILLVGQKALAKLLNRDELEDVTRRLSHVATLEPLSRDQSQSYLEHRITIAGARRFPFDARAVEMIYDAARGNFRATDQLALKCLEVAHLAGSDTVQSNHVMEARKLVCP